MKTSKKGKTKLLVGVLMVLVLFLGLGQVSLADGLVTVTVEVTDSGGGPIEGATIIYGTGSYYTFGVTDATGKVTKDLTDGRTYKFYAKYNHTSSLVQSVAISGATTVKFQTVNAKVKVEDCLGVGIQGATIIYGPGSYYTFGSTDAAGVACKELFAGRSCKFYAKYNHTTSATQSVVVSAADPLVTFTTTKVTLCHSGRIIFRPGGSWYTFNKPSMELFAGTYPFKFSGQEKDITVSGCSVEKTVVVLKLKDHNGDPLAGGKARGGNGSSYSQWHVPGSTDANGVLVDVRDGSKTTMSYEMRYNNTTQHKTQDVSTNSVFEFQTDLVTLRLETCHGDPLAGGNARYGVGSTYTTWWFPGGVTGSNGEAYAEFFPGTYSFEMQYQSTAEVKSNVVLPAGSPVVWKTTKVTLSYFDTISYGGSSGDLRYFNKPSMELLPGTYKFHFRNGGGRHDLTIGGCEMGGKVVILSLHNEGVPLDDPKYYLDCSGIGKLYNGDLIFTDKTTLSCRARAGSIAGPWFRFDVADSLLTYEYATVHVRLFNGDEELGDPHRVQVSGVGDFTTCNTFHVPANTNISYRLHRGGVYGPWQRTTFSAGKSEWELEFATVHVKLHNDGDLLDPPHKVQVSGSGDYKTGDTFHVPPGTNISYRLHSSGIYGPWQRTKFPAGKTDPWKLEFATVHVNLHNDDEPLGDPHRVQVSGVGDFTTCEWFHVPPDTNISYRLHSGGVYGPWQRTTFAAGKTDPWKLEFATVHVNLHNDGEPLGDPHRVQVSGVGDFTTCEWFHVPPGTKISYRLHRGGVYGPWQRTRFPAGKTDPWKLEFATVHVNLHNEGEPLGDPHRVQVSGVGDFTTCDWFHVPPGTKISYRLHSGGVYGPWQRTTFSAGKTDPWKLEFATVHVVIHGPGSVQVSSSGEYTTCDTFHVPPDTNVSYRLRCCGVYESWQRTTFPAGKSEWELECPLEVVLFNGNEVLGAPHKVQVSGSGDYVSGDTIPWKDLPAQCRLHSGGIYGPWQTCDPANDDGKSACKLELEFATVHVTLYNDTNGNGKIDDGEKLDAPHMVQVSGSGDYKTGDTFHVPPGTNISYRLHSGGIYGGYQVRQFDAGFTEWPMEFATVHVRLFNGDEELGDPNRVQVSGVGDFTTGDTFHVPPGTKISYRLHSGGIYGGYQVRQFDAGFTEWDLEFATVHVTLFNDENGDDVIQDGEKLDPPHKVEVSGSGDYKTCDTFHVPPDTNISYRLHSGGIYGPWQKQTFPAGFTEWELEFATVHVTLHNEGVELGDPHRVEVSGSGDYTTCDTFHVPPGTLISYRLHSSGIYGPWQKQTFPAGFTEWKLEFATVHVTVFKDENGDGKVQEGENLYEPYKVQVSGSGDYETCNTFHVPPDTNISYRLHNGGVYGDWRKQKFGTGFTEWELEFDI